MGNPVLVDRLGYMLAPGNTVTKIADGTRFVVTTVERSRHNPTEPTEWTLYDDNNTSVSAKNVMLDDTEQRRRASYCQHCGNHFNTYVDWQSGCGCIIEAELHYKRTKAKVMRNALRHSFVLNLPSTYAATWASFEALVEEYRTSPFPETTRLKKNRSFCLTV